MKKLSIPFALATLAISGCNNGGTTPFVPEGVFVDSAVSGITYQVIGEAAKLTEANGTFVYTNSNPITFSIGNIDVGTASQPNDVLTLLDLVDGATDETDPFVTNIARFLQTVDDDGNPANGINITEAVRTQAQQETAINFSQTIAAFENDPNVTAAIADLTVSTAAGARSLVSAADAQAHFRATLFDNMAGKWHGTINYVDLPISTFVIDISSTGHITGTANIGNAVVTTDQNGNQNSDGTVTVAVSGDIDSDGSVLGTSTATFASAAGEISFTGSFNNSTSLGTSKVGARWTSLDPIVTPLQSTPASSGVWGATRD